MTNGKMELLESKLKYFAQLNHELVNQAYGHYSEES